jgi:hypothetical protein
VLDRCRVVSAGVGGVRGAFPQLAAWLSGCGVRGAGLGCGEFGGGGVAGGGQGGGPGAHGAVAGPGERGDGFAADLDGIGVFGDSVDRVEVVAGDHVGHFIAVAGEGGTQVGGDH